MATFAQIDENNVVLNVIVIPDEHVEDAQVFINNELKLPGNWVRTFTKKEHVDDGPKRFAGRGMTYDKESEEFIPDRADFDNDMEFDEAEKLWKYRTLETDESNPWSIAVKKNGKIKLNLAAKAVDKYPGRYRKKMIPKTKRSNIKRS